MANRLKSVTMTNFMSFGQIPTTIDLDRADITLVLGNNQDVGTDGDSRNGAGKSVIFNALFWVLFDEPVSDIKQDEMICLFNGKHMEVSVDLEVNGVPYRITRGRKPNHIELLRDGKPWTMDATRSIDESIRILLGTNPEIFKNTYVLDVNQNSFMSLKPAAQRDFMEKFLKLETLSERAKKLKEFRANNDVELAVETRNLDNIRNYNSKLRASIIELEKKKGKWIIDTNIEIDKIKSMISEYEKTDVTKILADNDAIDVLSSTIANIAAKQSGFSAEKSSLEYTIREYNAAKNSIDELNTETRAWKIKRERSIKSLQDEVTKNSTLDVDGLLDMHHELSTLTKELVDKRREGKSLDEKYTRLSSQLESKIAECDKLKQGICPTCKQPFHDADMVARAEQEIMNIRVDVSLTEKAATKLLEEITDAEALILKLKENLADKPLEVELNKVQQKILVAQNGLNRVISEINPFEAQLQKAEIKIVELKDNVALAQQRLDTICTTINALEREHTETQNKLKAYGNVQPREVAQNIRSQLESARAALQRMTTATNPYIEQIDFQQKSVMSEDDTKLKELQKIKEHLDILIKLLSDSKGFIRKNIVEAYVPFLNITVNNNLVEYGSVHTLKINGDLDVELFYMDYPVSYGSLSKGEKLRLNFAFSMALRDMKASFGHKFNVSFIDEYFDAGADTEFFKRVFGALSRENRGVFIISHRDELKTLANREMVVTKSGGFSSVSVS